ncbi:MAG: carbohydrate ABC transporter substrate-binding protein, partial [Clostridiales bacterium]|nr:carbohydrate ABC transporter substrate-binding protein [Clostridiales bacterium]
GCCAYLGGQNMFEYYVPAGKFANAKCIGPLDDNINYYWREQVRQYTAGEKTKEEALEDFKTDVYYLGISS